MILRYVAAWSGVAAVTLVSGVLARFLTLEGDLPPNWLWLTSGWAASIATVWLWLYARLDPGPFRGIHRVGLILTAVLTITYLTLRCVGMGYPAPEVTWLRRLTLAVFPSLVLFPAILSLAALQLRHLRGGLLAWVVGSIAAWCIVTAWFYLAGKPEWLGWLQTLAFGAVLAGLVVSAKRQGVEGREQNGAVT